MDLITKLFKGRRDSASQKDPWQTLANLLSAPKILFDVGAHKGETTTRLKQRFPFATIYSFEPFPAAYADLCAQFGKDTKIHTSSVALSNQEGKSLLHVNHASFTNSLLPNDTRCTKWVPSELMKPVDTVEIEVSTLDAFCDLFTIQEIDLLKIDTQGNDLKVLKGAEARLKQGKIFIIYVEVNFVPIYKGQGEFFELCQFLANHHYRLYDLFDCAYSKEGQLLWGDALFLLQKDSG